MCSRALTSAARPCVPGGTRVGTMRQHHAFVGRWRKARPAAAKSGKHAGCRCYHAVLAGPRACAAAPLSSPCWADAAAPCSLPSCASLRGDTGVRWCAASAAARTARVAAWRRRESHTACRAAWSTWPMRADTEARRDMSSTAPLGRPSRRCHVAIRGSAPSARHGVVPGRRQPGVARRRRRRHRGAAPRVWR